MSAPVSTTGAPRPRRGTRVLRRQAGANLPFPLEHIVDAACWIDAHGTIVDANAAAAQLLGFAPAELCGLSLWELDRHFPKSAWAACWADARKQRMLDLECDPLTKDLRTLRVQCRGSLVSHQGSEYLLTLLRDVTGYRRTVQQYEQQIQQLTLLNTLISTLNASGSVPSVYEAAMDGFQRAFGANRVAILVAATDGVFRFSAWRGLSSDYRQKVEGHSFWAVDDTEPRPVCIGDVASDPAGASFRDIFAAEGMSGLVAVPLVARHRLFGKCMLYFDQPRKVSAGEVQLAQTIAGHVACAVDREKAEADARASDARFRALLQHSSDITSVLCEEGRIRYHSPAFYRILGWSEEDVLGKPALDFVHPDERSRAQEMLRALIAGTPPAAPAQFSFRKADGSYITLEAVATNRLDDPSISGLVFNSRDVTERNRLERQLQSAQKMEAVGRLAGGIAHDFNNYLTVVEGCSDLLLADTRVPEDLRRYVKDLQDTGRRAARLTGQLLVFGKRPTGGLPVVDVNALVRELSAMLRRLVGDHITLRADLDPQDAYAAIDEAQLDQVVVNLVINARDAMPNGGVLAIRTVVSAATVAVTVSDTGSGMSAATAARIFEPFFSTKPAGVGTGLGLATVYAIVQQHGGSIDVDTQPGRGTSITTTFPRVQTTPSQSALMADGHVDGHERILLVEDDEQVRELVRDMLIARGYVVIDVAGAADALEYIDADPSGIDLVLTDVTMPGLSGPELAIQLKNRRPDLPVLFMSGWMDHLPVDLGVRADGFVRKPFQADALARVLRSVLAGKVRA